MSEFGNLEKPRFKNENIEPKFELSASREGREIRERLEKEYDRRIGIFRNVLEVLEIPKDSVILKPPVLDRTDFGYNADIDLIFLGTDKQGEELYQKLYGSFEILPSIDQMNQKRLTEIKKELPEFHQFLMQRKGNIPAKEGGRVGIASSNFWEEAPDLEAKSRTILSPSDKLLLKEKRLEIGRNFVEEVKQKVPVLGHNFSGSMMTDMDRFGVSSDLDVDFLTNPGSEKTGGNAFDWIHYYLTWKYAEKFGIKIDAADTSLDFARQMASNNPEFIDHYKKDFGIDVTKEIGNSK